MKSILRIIAITLSLLNGLSQVVATQAIVNNEDSVRVESIIQEAASLPADTCRTLWIARQFLSLPYMGGTLETGGEERLVVNISEFDCVTLVETVVAMYLCVKDNRLSYTSFLDYLRHIRYAGGVVNYTERLHYFSQWIEENTQNGLIEEVCLDCSTIAKNTTLDINYMSTHADKYVALTADTSLIGIIAEKERVLSGRVVSYIPKSQLKNDDALRSIICDGDIIAIVSNKPGLDIAHVGLAAWHADGLHLLNASSLRKKVVEEPLTLYDYMQGQRTQIGIRVIHIK